MSYEKNIIKQCFHNVDTFNLCAATLTDDMFMEQTNKNIWKVFMYLYKHNINLSLSSVRDTLRDIGSSELIDEFGSILTEKHQDEEEWKYHVFAIKENYKKHLIFKSCNSIIDDLGLIDSSEAVMSLNNLLFAIDDTDKEEINIKKAMSSTIEDVLKYQSGQLRYAFKTGLNDIDELCPIFIGEYLLLAGDSGSGKTAFIIQLIKSLAENNKDVSFLLFSLEMKFDRIMRRFISNYLEISEDELTAKNNIKLSDSQYKLLQDLGAKFKSKPPIDMEIFDKEVDIFGIITKSKKFINKKKNKNCFIIVDNLDKISKKNEDSNMHHNQCSQALLALKQETNCNVILLHHLSKEIKRKSDKSYKPDIVDIRGSQKVVDDVDAVFLTWRPDAYEDVISNDPSLEGAFVLVPAKYRDGSKDYDIMLKHDIKYSKFSNLD